MKLGNDPSCSWKPGELFGVPHLSFMVLPLLTFHFSSPVFGLFVCLFFKPLSHRSVRGCKSSDTLRFGCGAWRHLFVYFPTCFYILLCVHSLLFPSLGMI